MIMAVLALFSTIILLICELIHFLCHFEVRRNKSTCITIQPIGNIAFYPIVWCLYVFMAIIISSTITMNELLRTPNLLLLYTSHFAVILLSCWESLLSFHRFYKLKYYMTHRHTIDTKDILKRFLIFVIVYVSLCTCQMLFIHLAYPLIIAIYVVFNVYCEYRFVQMLLMQYGQLMSIDKPSASNIETSMIRAVYIMGFCSILSIITSTLLLYFVSVCDVSHYVTSRPVHHEQREAIVQPSFYPFLWCLTVVIYMFNFVQNREFMQKRLRNLPCQQRHEHQHTNRPTLPTIHNTNSTQPMNEPTTDAIDMSQLGHNAAATTNVKRMNTSTTRMNTSTEFRRGKALQLLGLQHNDGHQLQVHQAETDAAETTEEYDFEVDVEIEVIEVTNSIPDHKYQPPGTANLTTNVAKQYTQSSTLGPPGQLLDLKPTASAPVTPSRQATPKAPSDHTTGKVRSKTEEEEDKMLGLPEDKEAYCYRTDVALGRKPTAASDNEYSETITSWNILALDGFYSKKNVNSLHQLRHYNQSINKRHTVFVHKAKSAPTHPETKSGDITPVRLPSTGIVSTQSDPAYQF
eukprot:41329_1